MCGIYCYISRKCVNCCERVNKSDEWNQCKQLIAARGPDKLNEKFENLNENWDGYFATSVLWMQGPKLVDQPVIDEYHNILSWNGDIFSGSLDSHDKCDTTVLLDILSSSSDIISVLKSICGPYSFIYYQKKTNLLYFSRDCLGRHSLLIKVNSDEKSLILTSVASRKVEKIIELPAIGIFSIDLSKDDFQFFCHPWREPNQKFKSTIQLLESNWNFNIHISHPIFTIPIKNYSNLEPDKKYLNYLKSVSCTGDADKIIQQLLTNNDISERVNTLSKLLHDAVKVRIKKKPNYCRDCIKDILINDIRDSECLHAKVGILFSGGLDSAILAAIAHKYIPMNETIDLINVAFEKYKKASQPYVTNKRNEKVKIQLNEPNYDVPDRKTGRQTYAELQRICPERKWNFIEVNITQAELQEFRSSRITNLLHPLCTILDESIGCAMWFASRAHGVLMNTNTEYESPCRVLILGMGADELFGGYMRHRTILKREGWSAMANELYIEIARIAERNLGRDDRIASDHGRQPRFPYLDENITEYAQNLKPWERCYPTDEMPPGLGDKLLLRLVARKLGFQNTTNFPKRAFQFGSRIANSKENAQDISSRI